VAWQVAALQGLLKKARCDHLPNMTLNRDVPCKTKREFKLPWREAGPPIHHDDKVEPDQ